MPDVLVRAAVRRFGDLETFLRIAGRAALSGNDHNFFTQAKGVAYSGLLAFFPLLTSLATILVQSNEQAVASVLYNMLYEALPPGTEEIILPRPLVEGSRPASVLVVAFVLAIWAASGITTSLMQGFQAAFDLKETRSWLRRQTVGVALVLTTLLPVLLASLLIVFGSRLQQPVLQWVGVLPQGADLQGGLQVMGRLMRYFIAVGSIILASGLLYRFGPSRRIPWDCVWPGAFIATLLWLLATIGFGYYVRHVANYNLLYGSVGAVIALLVWMYVLSIIALYGAEFIAHATKLRQHF